MRTVGDVLAHLRTEFLEMPGLRLNVGQLRRLCGIDPKLCQAALDSLVANRFLVVSPDGYYTLFQEEISRPRAARAAARSAPPVRRAS